MASIAQSQGFRKLLFAPTPTGFRKWCAGIRKSKVFVKTYSLMSEESREWNAAEYVERKLLLKRLTGLEAQLDEPELLVLGNCAAGKTLDIREDGAEQMYFLRQEQQSFYIDDFRKSFTNQKNGGFAEKNA